MEDIDESEAHRRHTVSVNPKGEKEVPFGGPKFRSPQFRAVSIKEDIGGASDLLDVKEEDPDDGSPAMRHRGVTWSESSARKPKPRRRERRGVIRSAGFLLRAMGDMFDRITGRQRTRSVSKSKRRPASSPPD